MFSNTLLSIFDMDSFSSLYLSQSYTVAWAVGDLRFFSKIPSSFNHMNNSTGGIQKWQHCNFTTAPSPDESSATDWHNSQAFTVTCYIVMGLVALLGLLGNGLVLAVITLRPQMKNAINYYIRSLAIADSLLLLIALPLAIVKVEYIYNWPLGKFICEVIVPLADTFIGASAWTITVIAIERHRAIVSCRYNTSLKYPRIALAITWVVSFSVGSLPLLVVTQLLQGDGFTVCLPMWPETPVKSETIYNVGTSFVYYVLPLAVILWTYVSISRRIHESKRFNRNVGMTTCRSFCHHEVKRIKTVTKAKKILTPVVITFAVTMFPLYCLKTVVSFHDPLLSYKYFTVLVKFCFLLAIVNSACNPVVYSIVCKTFRKEIKGLLKCKVRCNNNNRSSCFKLSPFKEGQRVNKNSNVENC